MRDRIQNYVFTPGVGGSGTIKLQGYVELEDILVITNVTTNTIIYQFSDPNKGAVVSFNTGVTADFPQSQNGVTTITLDFNTSTMSAADNLQIYVETREVTMRPWHFGTDAIERIRTAHPESLIDADFEYGLQNTKWQSLSLNNNIPSIFENPGADLTISTSGYATMITSGNAIVSDSDGFVQISNQTNGDNSPDWETNDYALIVKMDNTDNGMATVIANIGGSQTRTIQFAGNVDAYSSNDLVLITKVDEDDGDVTCNTAITSTATTTLVISDEGNVFYNGQFIQVETDGTITSGVPEYEIMQVTAGAGTGSLTVVRQVLATNPSGNNISVGNQVKYLNDIEVAQVYAINSNSEMVINRGWYNTPAINFCNKGTQITKLGAGTANLEIVKTTTISNNTGNVVAISRGQAGTTALSTVNVGSLFIQMVGIWQAGTANIARVGVRSLAHGVSTGGYISTQNHDESSSEGVYYVYSAENNYLFYYPKKYSSLATGYPLSQYDTVLRKATKFTGAELPYDTIVSDGSTPSTITVTTEHAHGLSPGTPLLINMTSGTNATYASGSFPILSVPSLTTFTFQAKSGAAVSGTLAGEILIKPNAYFIHRPYDGGIAMTNGSPHHGASAARQTKRYFRYQSGKGLFFTSGTLFAPTFDITECSADGTAANSNITITTEQNHNLQVGAIVRVSGIITTGYADRNYRVTSIVTDRSFVIEAQATLGATTPIFAPQPRINCIGWYGGVVRAGMFDDQNGLFWEYDGESLNVIKRSATYQVAGYCSVQAGSNFVTGDGTCRFQDQLKIGDNIVIRGMTHTVTSVPDQNEITVVPEYRGVNNETRIKLTLVLEQRIPQEQFNVDVMDSTGPSGYQIDPAKMQMIMIQYTWYGAGFIEFGVRGPNGKMILAHRIKNNNVNDEAFMRSGNLPCRYEAASTGALTKLYANIDANVTYFSVNDGTFLPGNVSVEYPAFLSIENEIVKYTGITKGNVTNTVANITGVTRAATLTQWIEGQNLSFTQGSAVSHTAGAGVYVLGCTTAPTLTHWGSAVIMDGKFDEDKGFSFTFNRQNVSLPSTYGERYVMFLMRLAPSVSNTIIGLLGTRDLVNRAQVNPESLIVNITGGRYLVEGILNPENVNLHTSTFVNLNTPTQGNQPSFTQFSTNIQVTTTSLGSLLPSAATYSGTAPSGGGLKNDEFSNFAGTAEQYRTLTFTNVPVVSVSGSGSGAFISGTIYQNGVSYDYSNRLIVVTVLNPGTGYAVGDQLKVTGNLIARGTNFGNTPTHDLTFDVDAIAALALGGTNIEPISLTGGGSGANISVSIAQSTVEQTDYAKRDITYSINDPGTNYAIGDQLLVYGNLIGGTFSTNDLTLTITSVSVDIEGGERLFAIPINETNSGVLDLRQIKQLGTSAIPGNGVYPDGPEILAITVTALEQQATQQFVDIQLSFTESQA